MAERWYYAWNNERCGPFSTSELRALEAQGKLQPTDVVWKEGIERGVAAGKVRGLFEHLQSQTVSENAIALVVDSLPSALQPSKSSFPRVPTAEGKSSSLPFSKAEPPGADIRAQEIVPDGLIVKGIAEDKNWPPPEVVTPFKSPAAAKSDIQSPETTPAAIIAGGAEPEKQADTDVTQPPVRSRRAMGVTGALLVSQDGERVRFRKKCVRCGYEDSSKSVARITSGLIRQQFFCPKCRKQGEVILRGT